jgi:hypothetical protein
MRSKLFEYVIRQLSGVLEQPWRSLRSLLYFALRFAIAFLLCLWLYSYLYFVQDCILFVRGGHILWRLAYCPPVTMLFLAFDGISELIYKYGLVLPQVLFITGAAFAMTVAWGAICRRMPRSPEDIV